MRRRFHPSDRILIVRTDRIGDVVLSLPVISALRKRFPKARLAMLIQPAVEAVVSGHPDLDAVLFDDPAERGFEGFYSLVHRIRKEKFDAVLVLHPTLRLAVALALAGIRIRVGTGYRLYSFLFNRRVHEHRKVAVRHEAEYNLSLARKLGAEGESVVFKIRVPEEAGRTVDVFLRRHRAQGGGPLVVLHPGSRGSALDWPVESFVRLAEILATKAKACVVFTGGTIEKEMIRTMEQSLRGKAVSAAGLFNLKELCALLERADLFVSNSTGPLHVARAMNTEVIGFYPPLIPASPRRWGPDARPDSVLMPDHPACRTCVRERCPDWNCMKGITVENVWTLACVKLKDRGFSIT
jgi:heptosyltransferase-3